MSDPSGEMPTKEQFAEHVNSVFRAGVADEEPVEFLLTGVEEHVSNEIQENFSLYFRAPSDAAPQQGIYRLESESLGRLDLFMVPIKRDAEGLVFEAVFNRLVGRNI